MMIEQLFEHEDPDVLTREIEVSYRQESMLMASRMASIGELLAVRTDEAEAADPDPGYAIITGFARTSAEVGAAMNMAPMAASELVSQAEALDCRLPSIARLLEDGDIDWPSTQLIITRTELVSDDLIDRVDQSIAERVIEWPCWSRQRIINAVDTAVRAIDPDAVKERRERADDERHISVTPLPDGTAQVRGKLKATAAAVFDKRLAEMATSVCAKDSRTIDQRRSDAVEALSEGRALTCDCGQPDCPARATEDEAPSKVTTMINVVATEATVTGQSDQPGYLEGYGVIDAEQVRELAKAAKQRLVECPPVNAAEALRYQPSAALERWIRFRDLTCRFPGCNRKAWFCDLDHTTPFSHRDPAAGGLTVPCDLACYCREHHRLKTFHDGWQDEQLPDGTIVWTSPTGRVYRTTPEGYELFPQMRPPPCQEPTPRRRNRSREKAARIKLIRNKLRDQRPINSERRRVDQARRDEIELRKWRNNVRKMRIILKGGKPSTSPWCPWANDPLEPEHLPPDWQPPPPSPQQLDDDPPF